MMSSASVESQVLQEPDHIVALLEACDDSLPHSAAKLSKAKAKENQLVRQAARFLDALARLLVCEARTQVIALSVLAHPPPEAQLHFFVAHNGPEVPACVPEHLRFIVDKLSKTSVHIKKRYGDPSKLLLPPFIDPDTSDDIEVELLNLEHGLLRHSWNVIHKRLVKDDRCARFLTLANDILGCPEPDRGELTPGEHDILEKIKHRLAGDNRLRSVVQDLCEIGRAHV